MAQVQVMVVDRGHDGRTIREPGEVFEVDESRLKDGSTWFAAVDKAPKAKKADPNQRPPGAGPAKGSAPPDITGDIA